jgi:hypothetical protein
MPRVLIVLLALLSLTSAARSDTPPSPTAGNHATLFNQAHSGNQLLRSRTTAGFAHPTPVALSCCKVCTVGKACGNTCISRDKTCHVGAGCACDG